MNWNWPTKYAQLTECGRYSVAKVGNGTRFLYEAWRTRAHPCGAGLIRTGIATADEARLTCEKDDSEWR